MFSRIVRLLPLLLLALLIPLFLATNLPTYRRIPRSPPASDWYNDAKLGIFVHWGLYSVPGWAPLVHPNHDFSSQDYITNNPYAEWYYNTMRIDGSPTQKYHQEKYGNNYDYYNFAAIFNTEIKKWKPVAVGGNLPRGGSKIRRPHEEAS